MGNLSIDISDFAEESFLDEAIAQLTELHDALEGAIGRTNQCLWRMLAGIYVWAPRFDANTVERGGLRQQIKDRSEEDQYTNWLGKGKSATQLLIARYKGIAPDAKTTRSQWNRALLAAEAERVPRNANEFVSWIQGAGGMMAAGQRYTSPNRASGSCAANDWQAEVSAFASSTEMPIALPQAVDDDGGDLQELAIVLVKRTEECGRAIRIATIVDEKLVRSVAMKVLREEKRARRENEKIGKGIESDRYPAVLRRVSKKWEDAVRAGRSRTMLSEYVSEGYPDIITEHAADLGYVPLDNWLNVIQELRMDKDYDEVVKKKRLRSAAANWK